MEKLSMASNRKIIMLGPSLSSKGGIASVVHGYQQFGLFERYPILFIETQVEGSRFAKLSIMVIALLKVSYMLLLGRVSVVHVHVARWNSFWRKSLFFCLARVFRRPYIVHIHSGGFPDFYHSDCKSVAQYWIRSCLKSADQVAVLTSPMSNWLNSISPRMAITKVPNFIDLPPPFATNIKSANEQRVILFLGRFTKEKGVLDLLDATALLKTKGLNFTLVLAGDGERDLIESKITALGLTGVVEMPGWLEGDRKANLLRRAQIFVLPSYTEGLPMGILEAMSIGCPVIASNVGGVPDQIQQGISGVLVEPGNVVALADAMNQLLVDSELGEKYAAVAKLKVEACFSPTAMLPIMDDLYQPYLP
jgi:glycosyltransferase involved in cell wall biosynthesis